MSDKEKIKTLHWLVAFLLIALIAAGVYIVSTELNDDVNITETTKQEKNEEPDKYLEQLSVNSETVKNLFETFREDDDCSKFYYGDDLNTSTSAKKYIAYKQLNENDFKLEKCGSLDKSVDGINYCSSNDKAWDYYMTDWEKFAEAIKDETTTTFSAKSLKEKYKEIFGNNASYTDKSFSIGEGPIAYYDKTNELYAEFKCECGGDCELGVQSLNNISQSKNELVLYTTYEYNDGTRNDINYTFELETETNNYIFISRESK